jgi:hypothetical protein
MPMTLIEAAKRNSADTKRAGVIEMFAMTAQLLNVMPFEDIPGGSLTYNLEGQLPGVSFRGFNEAYSESTGIINPETERLYIAGGDLDVDKALIKTRGYGIRATEETSKVKALAMHISDRLINGDTQANPREFDGLKVRIGGSQLFVAAGGSADGPLSLEVLDAAIDLVDNPTALVMSKALRRKLTKAARGNVGGDIQYTTDNWGRQVASYNDLPIVIQDYNELGQRTIDWNEIGPSNSATTNQSIYVVSLGTNRVMGLQNGTIEVNDLGELQAQPVFRTRVEWLVGLAVMHGRAAARIWGIQNADVTE